MTFRTLLAAVIVSVCGLGCSGPSAESVHLNAPPAAATTATCPAPTAASVAQSMLAGDDAAVVQSMQQAAQDLIAAKKLRKAAELQSQLTRANCQLALPAAAGDAKALAPAELYSQRSPSVLMVGGLYKCKKCSQWHASLAGGFAIARDVFVTNYHVMGSKDAEFFLAMTPDGKVLTVKEILAANKAQDVAIVRVEGPDLTPLPLAAQAPVGTAIFVISHPDGRLFTLTQGLISKYSRSSNGSLMMGITADFCRGSSGGPVFNDRGEVVGLVCSTLSVYYKGTGGRRDDLQMVVKECVPAQAVLGLIRKPG